MCPTLCIFLRKTYEIFRNKSCFVSLCYVLNSSLIFVVRLFAISKLSTLFARKCARAYFLEGKDGSLVSENNIEASRCFIELKNYIKYYGEAPLQRMYIIILYQNIKITN